MAQYRQRMIGNWDGIMAARKAKKKSKKVSKKKAKRGPTKKPARKSASAKTRAPTRKPRPKNAPSRRRIQAVPTLEDLAPSGEPEFVSNAPPVKL
jgi:hypothetical protein